jgi:hypothetical protein
MLIKSTQREFKRLADVGVLPMPTELRHVYRALLRAATYLPDSASRTYVHDRVVRRFRDVSGKIRAHIDGPSRETLLERYHGREHIRQTRQRARFLERAGLGSTKDLGKVFLETYGRRGSRRRQLLRELLLPEEDPSSDSSSLEKLIKEHITEVGDQTAQKKPQLYPPASKVGSFLRSQVAVAPRDTSLGLDKKIRSEYANIPRENAWGRPLPVKLQTSLKAKHWKKVLENILPPLPDHEWRRLRDLATGVRPIEAIPARRGKPIIQEALHGEESIMQLLNYFTTPVDQRRRRALDKDKVTISEESGATYWSIPRAPEEQPRLHVHNLTERSMRRLYGSIWNVTPMMEHDAESDKWCVKWGAGKTAFLAGQVSAPNETDIVFFKDATKLDPRPAKSSRNIRTGEKNHRWSKRPTVNDLHVLAVRQADDIGYTQGVQATTAHV